MLELTVDALYTPSIIVGTNQLDISAVMHNFVVLRQTSWFRDVVSVLKTRLVTIPLVGQARRNRNVRRI